MGSDVQLAFAAAHFDRASRGQFERRVRHIFHAPDHHIRSIGQGGFGQPVETAETWNSADEHWFAGGQMRRDVFQRLRTRMGRHSDDDDVGIFHRGFRVAGHPIQPGAQGRAVGQQRLHRRLASVLFDDLLIMGVHRNLNIG
ncbi:hypothetical protein D3C81_1451660 [compost metagenome]